MRGERTHYSTYEITINSTPKHNFIAMSIANINSPLLFSGLSLSSIYVFPSGNPQPADFLLVLAMVVFFVAYGKRVKGLAHLWPMILLTAWVAFVSLGWSAVYPSEGFIKPPLFYFFNCIFMIVVVNVFLYHPSPLPYFTAAVRLALLFSGLGVLFSLVVPGVMLDSGSLRVTGFFNNPNQLAHYNLCMIAALIILKKGQLDINVLDLSAAVSGVVGLLVASSLGGVAGLILLILAIFFGNKSGVRKLANLALVFLILGATVVAFNLYTGGAISDRLEGRLDVVDRKVDQIVSERKYDRMIAYPQYLWVGAAEGATRRFPGHGGGEIHSSLGTLLFSYGLVGLGLFSILLLKAVRYAPLYARLCIAAPLLYSVTHMGLRTTAFWFLIALMLVTFRYPLKRVILPTNVSIPVKHTG